MSNPVCMKSKDLSNQKKEQKIYPSQLNTKSIACRIPIADYVKFQQEAISKGINLNDWLLAKIYHERQQSELATNKSNSAINKSLILTETNSINPLTRQVEYTMNLLITIILQHDTLLILPGKDFSKGIILRNTMAEKGILPIEEDPNWALNLHRKLVEFANRYKNG